MEMRQTIGDKQLVQRGLRHLRKADATMGGIIKAVGGFKLKPSRDRYGMLVRSILSQQISVAAARTIRQRLVDQMPDGRLKASHIAGMTVDTLRTIGISRQKAGYLLDLSQQVQLGAVNFRRIGQLEDEAVIEELVRVKGIGRWTAQMFLIFALGRPDVFAPDDLGLRAAIRKHYGFDQMPTNVQALEIAECWSPFGSIASWYLWRSLEIAW